VVGAVPGRARPPGAAALGAVLPARPAAAWRAQGHPADVGAPRTAGARPAAQPRRKPTDNAHAEAFNARFRAECLDEHWFLDLGDARAKVESWRVDYNEVRPHSAIGDRPPMALISGPELPLGATQKPASLI
jgi:transposase InsO family protein